MHTFLLIHNFIILGEIIYMCVSRWKMIFLGVFDYNYKSMNSLKAAEVLLFSRCMCLPFMS